MAMNESDAVGLVYFYGLAIACFNSTAGRLDTTILREQEHLLSVQIDKVVNGQVSKTDTFNNIPRTEVTIEITGVGNPVVNGFSKYEPGNFNRNGTNDENDLRWIADLEGDEFHDTELEPTGESESDHDIPLSNLYIKNAELYTKDYTDYNTNKIEKDKEGNIISETYFGKYGYRLGAKLIADGINIKFKGVNISDYELEKETNTVYKIYIKNERAQPDSSSDFTEYYKVVKESSGRYFDLVKVTDTGDYFCGMVFCSRQLACDWS